MYNSTLISEQSSFPATKRKETASQVEQNSFLEGYFYCFNMVFHWAALHYRQNHIQRLDQISIWYKQMPFLFETRVELDYWQVLSVYV